MAFLLLVLVAAAMKASSNFSADAFQLQRCESKKKMPSRRDVLATITASSLASLLPPQPAQAKNDFPMNYQAVWYDPNHPDGYRILFGDDEKATLLLKDDPSSKELALPVKVIKEEGEETKLLFDFSKYEGIGSSDIEGIFTKRAVDKTMSEKLRIISFDDGRKVWINKRVEGPIGVFKDSSNPKRYVIIRQDGNKKGTDLTVELRDGDKVSSFSAMAGNIFTFNNFPDKGDVTATFSLFRRTLTFEDGTVWTKY